MKRTYIIVLLLILTHFQMKAQQQTGHYATVNGLKMYYEIHGSGAPLVLLHGGGSTIVSTYGTILPELSKTQQVIAIELQAHGHTADIDRPLSFEQDADDVAALLAQLHIAKANIMGFSNGGTTALQIAIRHPKLVNKLVLASALYKRNGTPPGFFDGFNNPTIDQVPPPLKEAFLAANPDPKGFEAMFRRDVARMKNFKDISDEAIKSIQAPALVISGYTDAILPEHSLLLGRTLPHAQVAILPGGHGDYIGEVCAADKQSKLPALVTTMIIEFLKS